ncbi:MAG: winged helix-turn-helix domain-containing protein [Pyrinomonadaceae bacterium]
MMSSKDQHSYSFKEFRLDLAERQLLRNEDSVSLTPKVFDLLAVLVERSGHLVEKDELLRLVWEDSFVEEANVARIVHSLRKTLGEADDNKFIETVPKKGYRFVAEVEKINGASPQKNGGRAGEETPRREDCINYILETGDDLVRVEEKDDRRNFDADDEFFPPAPPTDQMPKRRFDGKSLKFPVLGTLLVLAISAAAIFGISGYFRTAVEREKRSSIAVLPLKPIDSRDRDPIYELGIAESLILKLSSARDLTVRPLSATRKYMDLDQNPSVAGGEQEVDLVLSSNYQVADGKIRVTAQLIDVKSGDVEEVFKSEKDFSDVFLMQDGIANDIGNAFLAHQGSRENTLTARRGTANEEAYRLFLQAIYIFDRVDKTDAGNAVEYLERAIELDPQYAQAYVSLAYAYRFFAHKAPGSPEEQYLKSKRAIEKALALNPDLADAHAVLGSIRAGYEGNFPEAENEFKRAVELGPASPLVHALYANYLVSPGRFDEALREIERAIEIDPASFSLQIAYGTILYYARRYEEASAHFEGLIKEHPNLVYSYFWMWLLCDLRGDEENAYRWFINYQTQIKAPPETVRLYQDAYQKGGWKEIMRRHIEQDEKNKTPASSPNLNYSMACFSARLGRREDAFAYLEKAFQLHSSSINQIKVDPYLDSLHGDPRFDDLVKRVGLN